MDSCDRLITTDYNHTFTELSCIWPFLGLLIVGQKYRTNTIIIVHLATLMHVQVCGGVALDGALTGWGGDLEEVPLSNLASSLASSPGL